MLATLPPSLESFHLCQPPPVGSAYYIIMESYQQDKEEREVVTIYYICIGCGNTRMLYTFRKVISKYWPPVNLYRLVT